MEGQTKFWRRIAAIGLISYACAGHLFAHSEPVGSLNQPIPKLPEWGITVMGNRSLLMLGTRDSREGVSFAISHAQPEPRFRSGSRPAELVWEGYYQYTRSRKPLTDYPRYTEAVGVLAIARYRWERGAMAQFFEIGWGLQYANRATVDLESRWNSTPMAGFGLSWKTRGDEFLIGIRVLHISNAGTRGSNNGQNQLQMMAGYRF